MVISVLIAGLFFGARKSPNLQDRLVRQLENTKRLKSKRKKNFNGSKIRKRQRTIRRTLRETIEKNLDQ